MCYGLFSGISGAVGGLTGCSDRAIRPSSDDSTGVNKIDNIGDTVDVYMKYPSCNRDKYNPELFAPDPSTGELPPESEYPNN